MERKLFFQIIKKNTGRFHPLSLVAIARERLQDMIVTGGENVYSTEVENVLYMHPKILEAAVFGVPDEKWGEVVNAAVVLKEGESASEEDIIRFCKEHQASYKAPKFIVFLDELPKTGSGKIYKKRLRDLYAQMHGDQVCS